MEALGTEQMGQMRARMFQAQAVASDRDAGIELVGIAGPSAPITSSAGLAKIVALVGGGAVACLVVLILILRSTGRSRAQAG